MSNIRVSQLENLTILTSDDFMPIVDSSSLVTNHASIQVVGDWMAANGSSSYSNNSLSSSYSLIGGYTLLSPSSSLSKTSSYTSLAYYAANIPSITFISYSLSSSWTSASISSSYSLSSSYSNFPVPNISYSITSSWVSSSLSSSFSPTASCFISASVSDTASFISNTLNLPQFTKAIGNFVGKAVTGGGGSYYNTFLQLNQCSNIASIVALPIISFGINRATNYRYIVTFQNALPNTQYSVIGTFSSYGNGSQNPCAAFVLSDIDLPRTTTAFTMSTIFQAQQASGASYPYNFNTTQPVNTPYTCSFMVF
jgi:hypothetical protein